MSELTAVERAAGLYEQALEDRHGKECSKDQFFAAKDQAEKDVAKLLALEHDDNAEGLAAAGRLLAEAKRHGRLR